MDAKLFVNLFPDLDEDLLDIHTSASIGCDERVRDIIENSESKSILDARNKKGWTPLMYAACCANLKVVLLLLEEGAETDLKNYEGHTALILASKCGSSDVVNLLIDNDAKVNDRDFKGWTALFYAASFGHRRVVQSLIERGAVVNIADEDERISPLMLAAVAGHEMIVKDLLQLGANASAECKSGDTAKSLAAKNGHMNIKNVIDIHLHSKKKNHNQSVQCPDLASLLKELDLSKYLHIFQNHGIDLNTFWLLNDDDLKEIGIQLFGPRKKISMAIARYHQEHSQKNSVKEVENVDLLNENKKLYQLTEKLKGMVLHEKSLRLAGERKVSDEMRSIISISEKIKENCNRVENILCNILQEIPVIVSSNTKPQFDCIFQALDYTKRYIEFQHQKISPFILK